jgi:NDP-sugar pyrophosphorylase family protein
MQEVLFIGAGTRGAKLVDSEFQPYIAFHGKTCIAHVVEAAMQARSVGDIYIWGDKNTLERILAEQIKQYHSRIIIIEERENIIESFFASYLKYLSSDSNTLHSMISSWDSIQNVNWDQLRTYFINGEQWEKQVNVIVSDTPLISSYELDFLIENKNRNADMVLGRTARKDYKAILERLGEIPVREKSVKNFYTYRIDNKDVSLIVNSFIAGKPLKLDRQFL